MIPKYRKLQLAFICLGLLCSKSILAYDLAQAYQDARTNDPTYLSELMQKNIAKAQKTQARSLILPTVSVGASAYRSSNDLFFAKNITKKHPGSLSVYLNQPLMDLSSLTAFKQVNINSSAAELKVEQAEQDLITRVIQTYFAALLAQGNSSIAKAQETAAERQLKVAQRNFDVGNSTVIDKLEAQAAYHNAHAELISATSAQNNAFSALEDMVGHAIAEPLAPVVTPLHLKMPIPDSQEKWVERARVENLAVRLARLSDESAQLEVRRRSQRYLPVVNLVASQSWTHDNVNRNDNQYRKNSRVGLELSMPIFNGGLIGAQINEARGLQVQSTQAIRATEMSVVQATRAAYNQAVGGLATIAALEAARQASSASVKANSIGYNLGMRINIDVLNAQSTEARTQYNLAQAQYNALIGNVNLKSAIASLSEDDIYYINDLLGQSGARNQEAENINGALMGGLNKQLAPMSETTTNLY